MTIQHINRITVEFKYAILAYITVSATILIESQWNLNSVVVDVSASGAFILIESQWNLNKTNLTKAITAAQNINRITVEFKF